MRSDGNILESSGPLPQSPVRALRPIRVMVVDDSLTARSALSRMIDGEPDLKTVHKTSSAELALQELKSTPADIVLLDLEMPGMGGLAALPRILETHENIQVLVVSSLTSEGAEPTLQALSMGAADTMPKPRSGQFDAHYCKALFDKIRALGRTLPAIASSLKLAPPRPAGILRNRPPRMIAIGASTGGIHAMCTMLKNVSGKMALPILVTQHLPASFMSVFARQLEIASGRPAIVAADGTPIEAGRIHIAPGEGHLNLVTDGPRLVAKITQEPYASGCTPSVDPMFRSMAEQTQGCAIGVVLSGMGKDGADGAQFLHEKGGLLMVQDEESSAVWGMPGSVAKREIAHAILSPEALGRALSDSVRNG